MNPRALPAPPEVPCSAIPIPCSAARAAENRRVEREAATRDSNDLQQNSKFPTPEKFPGTCELPKKTAVADDGS
jgi:hypothetical protein